MRSSAKSEANLLRNVGKKIQSYRLKAGLRQEDLEDFGVSWKHYQKIESGQTNTTIRMLYKIAKALKCHPRDLLP